MALISCSETADATLMWFYALAVITAYRTSAVKEGEQI
jgi:hypothetical protein